MFQPCQLGKLKDTWAAGSKPSNDHLLLPEPRRGSLSSLLTWPPGRAPRLQTRAGLLVFTGDAMLGVLGNPHPLCLTCSTNQTVYPMLFHLLFPSSWTSLVAQTVKRLPTMWETRVQSLGQEDLLEKEMATHSKVLAWKIPWTEEPGRLTVHGVSKS